MNATRDLLIELGTEELPPKALKRLSHAFTEGVREGLAAAELSHGALQSYAAPRRLAILISDLSERQPDKQVERRGPAVTAAFDDEGCPTKAAEGFARSCGLSVEALERLETEQGSWLVHRSEQKGQPTQALIPGIVAQSLDDLPIPKRMRWSDLKVQFVRPVHWLVLLFGDEVIDAELMAVRAGRETRGHRFHHPQKIYIGEPAAYAPLLETEGHVLPDFDQRREAIRGQVMEAAAATGGHAVIDEDLLDEVTSMIEWPMAVLGNFEPRFLEVPAEALISAMKGHQKYFHVVDANGALLPHFVTVSNIESREPELVRAGNERVIRPRLTDADFFWNQDRKHKLASRLASLESVVFQHKLGSMAAKVRRLMAVAGAIAESLGGNKYHAERAAELAKCDLMTDMVGEFPELQGIMGRYYAAHDGEPGEVPQAIEEHYSPRFAGDVLPQTVTGRAVALADKLDTLIGIFAIGQAPTGDKDPFALRRAALGLVRILIEQDVELDLVQTLETAAAAYNDQDANRVSEKVVHEVLEFVLGRLHPYYNQHGYAYDEIDAVVCLRPTRLNDLDQRLRALAEFRRLPEAESLAAANKRISNIIKKSEAVVPSQFDAGLFSDAEEKTLANRLNAMEAEVAPLFAARDYEQAMKRLAGLREPVDAFFDKVLVMADDEAVRLNRLALLNRLRNLFLQVADISRLQ
jgi:glycyl-tRNA synthetase beta chain